MRRWPLAWLLLVLGYGCARFGTDDPAETPPVEDEVDAGKKPKDAGREAAVVDANAPDATPPPDMVLIQTTKAAFFIDRHEATATEWDAVTTTTPWLDGVVQMGLPQVCKDAKSGWTAREQDACIIDENEGFGFTHDDEPVNCVDWCDAVAFCLAKGKHLCGGLDGGPLTAKDGTTLQQISATNASAWTVACGGEQVRAFPYGPDFVAGKCNRSGTPTPAASFPNCVGSVAGLLEMAGNLNEWDYECLTNLNACMVRGGAYRSPSSDDGCKAGHVVPRPGAYDDVGFRCCADLPK